MTRATGLRTLRKPIVGLVALASFAALTGGAPAAQRHAARTVTFHLSDSGVGNFSNLSETERSQTAIKYSWTGVAAFKVPARKTFSVLSKATLVGTWTGDYRGTRFAGQPNPGDFHCTYAGKNVKITVTAQLVTDGARKVDVVLTRNTGFFPAATGANCSNEVGTEGPSHFSPSWLFRDTVTDHYRLSSSTAVLVLPRTVLNGGTATAKFPNEVGSNTITLKGKVSWHNVGRLRATVR